MVVNRLHKDLINSGIALRALRLNCQKKKFQMGTHTFFCNCDRDFYSEIVICTTSYESHTFFHEFSD
jgi:hypothetical protein